MNFDDIKITRLSDRKVRLDYYADIKCDNNIIERRLLKIRYKFDEETSVYKLLYPKPAFFNQLSNKLRVKKKFLNYESLFTPVWVNNGISTNKTIEIQGLLFNNIIISIYISDSIWYKNWNREERLKQILNEKGIN